MGLWPGEEYFGYRYAQATEYVTVMKQLWADGVSNFKGEHYTMDECVLSPSPTGGGVPIVAAGQSKSGMKFASEMADFNFIMGTGINTPTAISDSVATLVDSAAATGRDVGRADPVHDHRRRDRRSGTGEVAGLPRQRRPRGPRYMADQSAADATADDVSTARTIALPEGAVNFNMGTLVGSYETVAKMLDEVAELDGIKGIMLTFDDFLQGIENFGTRIQPLMKSRNTIAAEAA